MARSKEVFDIVPLVLSELYGIHNTDIKRVQGGRLSDTFKVTALDKTYFLKISRQIEENTPFSTKVTEAGILLGFPFPKTYKGGNGKLYQEIPGTLGSKVVPDFLRKMTVTLVDYHKPPEAIPDTPSSTRAKFYAMGEYLGKYHKFNKFAMQNMAEIPGDQLSPENIRAMIYKTFALTPGMSRDAIDEHARSLGRNLTANDKITKGFAEALKKGGQLPAMLDTLDMLIERDRPIKHTLPKGLLNNDIKQNNLFFDMGKDHIIALAFDLDMVTMGPLVKDLGRTIALTCFDKETGALQHENMLTLIQGRANQNPLTVYEAMALSHYVEIGILASYALRTSYFAEMLHGKPAAYEIERLNPAIHAAELLSFRNWCKENSLVSTIVKIQAHKQKSWEEKDSERVGRTSRL